VKDISVLGLPVYTLSRYGGMARSPSALRKAGLVSALGPPTRDYGDAELPEVARDRSRGGTRNLDHFTCATSRIFTKARELESAERVVCLGGECSLIVGGLAGLSEVSSGRPGLIWIDSHGDFNAAETSPSGYIGGCAWPWLAALDPGLSKTSRAAGP